MGQLKRSALHDPDYLAQVMRPGMGCRGMRRQGSIQSANGNYALLTVPAGRKYVIKNIASMNVTSTPKAAGLSISGTAWLQFGHAATPYVVPGFTTSILDLGLVLNSGEILNGWADTNTIYSTVSYVDLPSSAPPVRLYANTVISTPGYFDVYTAPTNMLITHMLATNTNGTSSFIAMKAKNSGMGGGWIEHQIPAYGWVQSDTPFFLAQGDVLQAAGVGTGVAISGYPIS